MSNFIRFTFSILLLICGLSLTLVRAQEQDSTRAPQKEKEEPKKKPLYNGFSPSAIRLGVSLSDLIGTLADDQSTYYSFQLDVPIRQYMLVVDYGRSQLDLMNTQTDQPERNFTYTSQGSFFRGGIEANLLKDRRTESNDASDNVIFFGLKYARSVLDDQVTFQPSGDDSDITASIYDITQITEGNNNLSTWWLEMNAGVKVSVFDNIFLGYTLRYKFARQTNEQSSLIPYEIPGFGDGDTNSAFSFDYYIYYRIPFKRKQKKPD